MHKWYLESFISSAAGRGVLSVLLLSTVLLRPCWGATDRSCPGGVAVSTFRLLVKPAKSGAALPVTSVNVIEPGQKLRYEPVRIAPAMKYKAKVALVLVPAQEDVSGHIRVLAEKPANVPAEWDVPVRSSAVGVVFGEHGVDEKKVNALVAKNPQLISDLADYAERTSTVEALVQTLANYEQSAPGGNNSLQAVLHGFSAQYGTSLPTMDPKAPADQQATQLMHAIVPALSANGDTPAQRSLAMQSTGLAASLGSLFLGNPVALAVGGAALLDNIHASLFPSTDFRPAFTQSTADGMELCTANQEKKAHTRLAYLWMFRVPDSSAPSASLIGTPYIPIGGQPAVKVSAASVAQLKLLPRARDWRLVAASGSTAVPVKVAVGDEHDTLTLDLRKVAVPPGEYKLAGDWDWSPMEVAGAVNLRPFADLSKVKSSAESADRLITGSGTVTLDLAGADFEFIDKVSLEDRSKRKPTTVPLSFALPNDKEAGEQHALQADVDTALLRPGQYSLLLRQLNGTTAEVPVTVHPPNPQLDHLPLPANLAEPEQVVRLQGRGLERIERITSPAATWTLAPAPKDVHDVTERQATVKLDPQAHRGDLIPASIFVMDLQAPLQVPNGIEVLGARPKIVTAKASFASATGIELHEGELPAGTAVSFSLQVDHVDARPSVELACSSDRDTKQMLTLTAGEKKGNASLDVPGDGALFLSVDPGTVGQSGCNLVARVRTPTTGVSDPFTLGRIIDLPQIDKFLVSDEKVQGSLYAATLTGKNLQMIEKTGWDSNTGYAVQSIATPVPGTSGEQTLKIAVPWPSPSPRAPLFVWLRGESEARSTQARY